MNGLKQARADAERANQYAKSPDQQLQISSMLRHLDALEQNRDRESAPIASSTATLVAQTPSRDSAKLPEHGNHGVPRDVPSIHWPGNLQHVEAVAKSFDCDARSPRLHVIVNSREMVFGLDDPTGIIVRNRSTGSFDFQCGPQKPFKVGIFYVQSGKPKAIDGMIRELVF
jgi:hypothetical protein